jgi:hypothetical protein
MQNFSNRIAVVAFIGVMTAITPVLAAPNTSGGNSRTRIDCSLPENANLDFCLNLGKGGLSNHPGTPDGGDSLGTNGSRSGANDDGSSSGTVGNNNGPYGDSGKFQGPSGGGPGNSSGPGFGQGPRSGTFNWSRHDRDQFHQRFGGFNFGFFATPNFSIQLGVHVPHSFKLRPVPRSIYRAYPWFRGYLYFIDRRGDFVIVSPRTYRIIAVL